jgi:toxin ParE1/3/4
MGVGSRFQDELVKVYQFIQAHPGGGSRVRLRGTKAVVRKRNLKTFPYAVVYQLIPPGVLVVAVSHAKRKQNYWRRRLLP